MSKHTPGPWRVGTYGDRLAIYADGIYVAVVYSPPDDVAFIPEATANARLIAAAPDMLHRLHQAAAVLRWYAITFGIEGRG